MIVSVNYLFSNNNKIGSKVISYFTKYLFNYKDIPSHVAVLINNRWVIESTMFNGVRIIKYNKWKNINKEVANFSSNNRDYNDIKTIYKSIKNKKYDFMGLFYIGYRIALNLFFNIDIPKVNKFQDNNKYFCSEAMGKLQNSDYQMMSPNQILKTMFEESYGKNDN